MDYLTCFCLQLGPFLHMQQVKSAGRNNPELAFCMMHETEFSVVMNQRPLTFVYQCKKLAAAIRLCLEYQDVQYWAEHQPLKPASSEQTSAYCLHPPLHHTQLLCSCSLCWWDIKWTKTKNRLKQTPSSITTTAPTHPSTASSS